MRKFMVIAIPILTLTLFILIMESGHFLKKPLFNGDDIPGAITLLIRDIDREEWEAAADHTEILEQAWEKVVLRTQFSCEREEINDFTVNLARLRGAIRARDKSSGLQELYEASNHWRDMGK